LASIVTVHVWALLVDHPNDRVNELPKSNTLLEPSMVTVTRLFDAPPS